MTRPAVRSRSAPPSPLISPLAIVAMAVAYSSADAPPRPGCALGRRAGLPLRARCCAQVQAGGAPMVAADDRLDALIARLYDAAVGACSWDALLRDLTLAFR